MMKVLIFFFSIIFLSCTDINKPAKTRTDSGVEDSSLVSVYGYWRLSEDDFVSMIIKKDSIFYPDQNAVSLFITSNNALIIFDSGYSYPDTMKYRMNGKDTLIFLVGDDRQVYVRTHY